jgi:hypothetical protein
VGITGASGGGTQSFILGGIDDRLAAAFPAVMVGTAMQGGCVCENCSYLRVGAGNVELAGLFAPRPLGMSGADDWTIDLDTKGLPQLKELYRLYNAEDKVAAKVWREFKHNYNQPAREMMYSWFNKHFKLGASEPNLEKPFVPVPPKELSVYDAEHPLPKDATDAAGLRKYLTATSDKQLAALKPKDKASLREFRRVYGTALRVMIGGTLAAGDIVEELATKQTGTLKYSLLRKGGSGQAIPVLIHKGDEFNGTIVVWVHAKGFGEKAVAQFPQAWLKKTAILEVSPFLCGEAGNKPPPPVDQKYAGFTFGYNRSVLANRVDDIVTAVAYARDHLHAKRIYLAGFYEAGPWVVLARALCGDAVQRCATDMNGFHFENITNTKDENVLPGALKYGGMARLSALCVPGELCVHNLPPGGIGDWLPAAYETAGANDLLHLVPERMTEEKVLEWLLR